MWPVSASRNIRADKPSNGLLLNPAGSNRGHWVTPNASCRRDDVVGSKSAGRQVVVRADRLRTTRKGGVTAGGIPRARFPCVGIGTSANQKPLPNHRLDVIKISNRIIKDHHRRSRVVCRHVDEHRSLAPLRCVHVQFRALLVQDEQEPTTHHIDTGPVAGAN